MTTRQTPDAVRKREIVIEKLREVEALEDSNMNRHAYAIRTFAKEAADYLAALDSRAGDAGEGALVEAARSILAAFSGPDPYGKMHASVHEADTVRLDRAIEAAATPAPAVDAVPAGEASDMAWFGGQHRLSLSHYSPMYGDDDDQSVEWRVMRESGPINDREWDIVGRGATPYEAVASARAALSHGEGRK